MRGRVSNHVGTILAATVLSGGTLPAAGESLYNVDGQVSEVRVDVGRAGLFAFAGHAHEVLASVVAGHVAVDEADVTRSSVVLTFGMAGLKVTGRGEPEADVAAVQAKMAGPEVLDVTRFPTATFRSTAVEGRLVPDGSWNVRVTGDFTLKGVTRTQVLPLRVHLAEGLLTATGQLVLKQRDFGLSPVSVAGVVKVKNELGIDYKIVGRLVP
jgi:polyisoprenoid-binding protein YceI